MHIGLVFWNNWRKSSMEFTWLVVDFEEHNLTMQLTLGIFGLGFSLAVTKIGIK